ncbi:hypothetical protein M413DRAFT_449582 [Hebeloma cylindrosporum]|uniref:SET domain-containing protein n=1 Tax=Hebeloma cylindrosporum TaxID=76867 RepID=A0A0C2Y447_HEBCY|nr:hypothetical protein M413DRAFT_449582 [Hebeloma cylindrosporum h7]
MSIYLSMTPVPDSQGQQPLTPALENDAPRDFISETRDSVWAEHAAYHLEHCSDSLLSLQRPHPRRRRRPPPPRSPLLADHSLSDSQSASTSSANPPSHPPQFESFTIHEYQTRNEAPLIRVRETKALVLTADAFPLYPSYNACAPISRNITVGDDPDWLPFIPFADDPTYDYDVDIEHHSYFAWPNLAQDPDIQIVILETIRRLISQFGLSFPQIADMQVFPLSGDEIIKVSRSRDFPAWISPFTKVKPLPMLGGTADSPKQIMNYFKEYFCNDLNCLTSFCPTHFQLVSPTMVAPEIPYAKLVDSIENPCGVDCFLFPKKQVISTPWTASDTENLFSFLDYAPDTSSCDLAIFCRRACYEIHYYRERYCSPVRKPKTNSNIVQRLSSKAFAEHPREFTPGFPCKHDGPCDAESNCECFQNKAHCHIRCSCNSKCPRRWKGCHCAKSSKVCGTNKCSCFKAHFECDPELCLSCEARDHNSNLCKNVSIQRGNFKRTRTQPSTYGLGLFLCESCQKDDLIIEYVGERIYGSTELSRSASATHRGRQYIFELNPSLAVDATFAGNEARFINHSPTPNCVALVFLVNGEHRIGIYAASHLEANSELFLNYGPTFFYVDKDENIWQGGRVPTLD